MREKDLIEPLATKGCRYGRKQIKGIQQRGFYGVRISIGGRDNYLAAKTHEMAANTHGMIAKTHWN
jgi:hypothetical protein